MGRWEQRDLSWAVDLLEIYGIEPQSPVRLDREESLARVLVDDVGQGIGKRGIITTAYHGSMAVGVEDEYTAYEYALNCLPVEVGLADLPMVEVLTVRVFNPTVSAPILTPEGREVMVPRKWVGAYVWEYGSSRLLGIDAEEMARSSSTDHRTGELMVPEETVDYVTTSNISLIFDLGGVSSIQALIDFLPSLTEGDSCLIR